HLAAVAGRLRAAAAVPGLLPLAVGRPLLPDEAAGLAGQPELLLVRGLLDEVPDAPAAGRNDVLAAHRALQSGPAADLDPQLTGEDVFAAAVVDPTSRQPREAPAVLADLARIASENRELLTRREHRIFEEHLLGQLGESLRARRLDADDLVRRTNEVLSGVSTSQGIRVRLKWTLTDDAGPEVRTAAQLLTRPLGSLLPEESRELRGALSRLIDASRQEDPDLPYAEHLGRALDYRQWSRFVVEIHRPGAAAWQALTRRTPLSQGEQKVVCYLPLFAAAAAHFESLAAGAPQAPRFVLLDDAFPKIDARTHPLLLGLLVQLDLDFVITSERLWGTFPEVPSLAVYEALRSPDEPGIAQLEFRWDGRRLTAVT
ncbi:MAG: SbcC/MukB-like Walker B domain-containing protein, partial [Actinomycetales bacterium]